jgi:hypothetical protein
MSEMTVEIRVMEGERAQVSAEGIGRPRTLSARLKIHPKTRLYAGEERNFW